MKFANNCSFKTKKIEKFNQKGNELERGTVYNRPGECADECSIESSSKAIPSKVANVQTKSFKLKLRPVVWLNVSLNSRGWSALRRRSSANQPWLEDAAILHHPQVVDSHTEPSPTV